jgi:cellulose synthase (UDP-forming)
MKTRNNKSLNSPLLPFITIAAILYFFYYLWWRAADTLNPAYPFFSWLLWGAEAFGVFTFILFSYFTRNIDPKGPFIPPGEDLKVDVFIPTYNEEQDVLEATLIGCNKIRYPHITYILDDGNRAWVQSLAEQMGVKYIARPEHDHAKAGNINYALTQTSGDFIVLLDADMVPQPEYLDRTLGYFSNDRLALIQMPQEFYNQDSIQHAADKTSWHEQSLFFRVIQPGKNYTNSAFWCGSPSVIRRKALEDVGGVATDTITEDIHTSVRLHSRGWETLFINEPLAFGIAPQTIKAFLLQRLRWAQGTMQLYRSKESPLWRPGLTFNQRLSYLSSFLAYIEAYQKVILITIPILILGFNILPMRVNLVIFAIHWVPYFILNIIANQVGGRGVFHYFKTEKYNLLKTVIFIQSTFTLFSNKPLTFKVTPKTVSNSVYNEERRSLIWYMVIFGSLIGAMVNAMIALFTSSADAMQVDAFLIAIFWAGYNAYVIMLALLEVFRKQHERKKYRFPINESGDIEIAGSRQPNLEAEDIGHSQKKGRWFLMEIDSHDRRRHFRYPVREATRVEVLDNENNWINAKILDLSLGGSGVLLDTMFHENIEVMKIRITPQSFDEITLPVDHVTFQRVRKDGKYLVGCAFPEDLGPERKKLYEYLFIYLPSRLGQPFYRVLK